MGKETNEKLKRFLELLYSPCETYFYVDQGKPEEKVIMAYFSIEEVNGKEVQTCVVQRYDEDDPFESNEYFEFNTAEEMLQFKIWKDKTVPELLVDVNIDEIYIT